MVSPSVVNHYHRESSETFSIRRCGLLKLLKMKWIIPILILSSICFCSSGQNKDTKKMLSEIEGKWAIDDNGNVTYQRIIEVPDMKKAEIYNRVYNYFVYNYVDGKSVIQTQDIENGQIIGKGFYKDLNSFSTLSSKFYNAPISDMVNLSTWHIVRIDIKDGKARIILTLTEYSEEYNGRIITDNVKDEYPVNVNRDRKNIMGKSFYKSHQKALASIDAIDKAIKEGNTSKQLENKEW